MAFLPLCQSQELRPVYWSNRLYDMWSSLSLSKVYLSFHYICPQLYLLRRFVSSVVCVIGVLTALLFGTAEYLHTQGMVEHNLYKLQLALKLFPYDFRFRTGLIQVADLKSDISTLLGVQKLEPNSVSLSIILIRHMRDIGDKVGASQQFKRAMLLKRISL